jgi:hypothetical protein
MAAGAAITEAARESLGNHSTFLQGKHHDSTIPLSRSGTRSIKRILAIKRRATFHSSTGFPLLVSKMAKEGSKRHIFEFAI